MKLHAVLQLRQALDDNLVAGVHTLLDDVIAADLLAQFHVLRDRLVAVAGHEHERLVKHLLDGALRHQNGPRYRFAAQAHPGEHSRQQDTIGVREQCLHCQGAGVLGKRPVRFDDMALFRVLLPVRQRHRDDGVLRTPGVQGMQAGVLQVLRFADAELDIDRVDGADGNQRGLPGHRIGADGDIVHVETAVHRRVNHRIVEVFLRLLEERRIGCRRRLIFIDLRPLRRHLLLGDRGGRQEFLVTLQIDQGVVECRFGLGQVRLGRKHRRLILTGIDFVERLPLGHELAAMNVFFQDGAGNARQDPDLVLAAHLPGVFRGQRGVLPERRHHLYRRRLRTLLRLLAAAAAEQEARRHEPRQRQALHFAKIFQKHDRNPLKKSCCCVPKNS